mgnify:CR=1 FL=1
MVISRLKPAVVADSAVPSATGIAFAQVSPGTGVENHVVRSKLPAPLVAVVVPSTLSHAVAAMPPWLDQLEALDLSHNSLDEGVVQRLKKRFGARVETW